MYFEPFVYPDAQLIAGVDEVGRGSLVGAVVTAAVILDPNNPIEGLTDSKTLTDKKRLGLFEKIKEKALAWSLGRSEPEEIDEINILAATMLAMERAVAGLSVTPDFVLVDGNCVPIGLKVSAEAVVKGDQRVAEISASSIIAKIVRDREMEVLDKKYPQYGFANHKGYLTKVHFDSLSKYGIIDEHRKSFKPIRNMQGIT
ncbi:ribonuclease HII [Candidatus Enterovibrio escicola]|uniref:Ribonuclease HII n=1 Tax=Candidatus Enterovibrio escicola TaxID=1927127 RepID=A0A2A5SZK9_9GAMM|nr:ribonuclease HII [Candidatus Enterovibrio escacola]PCS21320.1 Ribonuclease HII [Candidatus Enterovibrio escacola]